VIDIVGTRLAASVALLFLLVLGQAILGDRFAIIVALGLVIVPALSWMTFWFFAKRAVQPDSPFTLRVRTQDALALALASSVGGLLGLIVVARALNVVPPVDRSVFLVGLAFALLMIAAPAVNWLAIWRPWEGE